MAAHVLVGSMSRSSKSAVTSPVLPVHASSASSTVRIRSKSSRCCHMSNWRRNRISSGVRDPYRIVTLPNSWRVSWMWLMRLLSGAMPSPPATSRMSLPFISSNGKPRPNGPRIPMTSPHRLRCSAPVTSPASADAQLDEALLAREPRRSRWAPRPRRRCETSTNWPGLERERLARAGVDEPDLEELLLVGELDDRRDARRPGPVRVHRDAGRSRGCGDHRTTPSWRAWTTTVGLMPALQARAQRPQPTHRTRSNLDR